MAALRILLVISMLAVVAPAAVKREEFQPSEHLNNAHMPSAPVYQGQPMYSQKEPNAFANAFSQSQQLMYNQQHQPSGSAASASQPDYPEAAASNAQPNAAPMQNGAPNGVNNPSNQFQAQPNQANQPNLYYYYYPVQPDNKPKDAYQAQPSNQYSSQVQPNNQNGHSMHSGPDDSNNNQVRTLRLEARFVHF
jgi:hypothetical protein